MSLKHLFVGTVLLLSFSSFSARNVWLLPESVDFGRVDIDRGYVPDETVRIRNIGPETIEIEFDDIFCRNEFRFIDRCYSELRRGATCELDIRFRPYAVGRYSCNLYVLSSAGDRERLNVSATGYRRDLSPRF
ncbi:hypothetical protein GW915_06255 [bacterium]|nr:hypothetical protein [bacterium]